MTKTKKKTRAKRMKPVKAWAGFVNGRIYSSLGLAIHHRRASLVYAYDDVRRVLISELPQKGRQQ